MKNTLKGEIIGTKIKVIDGSNQASIGLEGKVVDETRNMLVLDTKKGIKKLIKKNIVFKNIQNGKRNQM